MSAELIVTNLEKNFAPGALRPAIDDVSFKIAAGEIVVLLGPSGCGKTTTLRSVAGLEKPTGGTIDIGGERVADPANNSFVLTQHRNLGMVFQSYAVWPHMTVEQNVAYPLRHRKVTKSAAAKKVADVLEIVGLSEYARRPVVALSGGQMQRVALARSLVYNPRILLLDEPLSNLDAKLRLRLREDLRKIIKAAGVTALYVTHDQSEAVVIGDRIGVMKDGKLRQMSDPISLYNSPVDTFVANFTGAGSLVEGVVEKTDGGFAVVRIGDIAEPLRARISPGVQPGDVVQVSIRPENIKLDAANNTPGLLGAVEAIQFEGTQTAYTVNLGLQTIQSVELGTMPRFAIGDQVRVTVPPDISWAFPKAQGEPASRPH